MKRMQKSLITYMVAIQSLLCAQQGDSGMAQIGSLAPDFSVEAYVDGTIQKLSLSDFNGCYKVLFFYPMDFTFVCPTELHAFQSRAADFKERNTVVLGVSVDSVHAHRAWAELPKLRGGIQGVQYPLLSDMKKTICRMYGVLDEETGVAFRGLFIIDDKNIIQCCMINNMPLGRNVDEVLRLIDAIKHTHESGMACPANWQEGQEDLEPTHEGISAYFQHQATGQLQM